MVPGFEDRPLVTAIGSPSVLAFAPDGRLFVGEKTTGRIRIIKDGQLVPDAFLELGTFLEPPAYVDTASERGLLGLAFDPAFPDTPWVYVYYTVCKEPRVGSGCAVAKNRVARFLAAGDAAEPGVQEIVLDDIDSDTGNHNGGWIGFGPLDAKLYVATGDGGATREKAQDLGSLSGKVLRLNQDGSVPADNPFVGQAGSRDEVWALGFRNPWRCRFDPAGRLFCGDVGNNAAEEVDVVVQGRNYGWPATEGTFDPLLQPDFTLPILTYDHVPGLRASVTGGDFGVRTRFPLEYHDAYFFGDFVRGMISRAVLDEAGTGVVRVEDFVTGIGGSSITDLVVGPDGDLYYAVYDPPAVHRISPVAVDFTVTSEPAGLEVLVDGESQVTPLPLAGLFGSARALSAPSPQFLGGQTYLFAGWSDGGDQSHGVRIPAAPATFVATFVPDTSNGSTTSTTVLTTTTTSSTSSTASTSTSTTSTSSSMPGSSTTSTASATTTTSATLATSTTATPSTSTTLVATCVPDCDDGDACTDDRCVPAVGCVHDERPATGAGGATCHVANLRALLHANRSCAGRCFQRVERQLERIERLVGTATTPARRCRRTLGGAIGAARQLERRMRALASSGIEPTARTRDEATRLREDLVLLRGTCSPRAR